VDNDVSLVHSGVGSTSSLDSNVSTIHSVLVDWANSISGPSVSSDSGSVDLIGSISTAYYQCKDEDSLVECLTCGSQLMKGSTPWRGSREKDPLLLQLLIESTIQVSDIVLDCIASTGT
jgi:hypothetical protein